MEADVEKILIIGNGGHARSLIDIIERQKKYTVSGFIVNEKFKDSGSYPIIGNDNDLEKLFYSGIENAAIGIGYLGKSDVREKLYEKLKRIGYQLPVICDPSAIISEQVKIGEGSFIGKGVIINTCVSIGKMCIINSGAVIEHDCRIADFTHLSVASVLCGEVNVGEASFIGANATVIQQKEIGRRCIIGAGTVIRKQVEDYSMVYSIKNNIGGGVKRGCFFRIALRPRIITI